jgi:hypothetical protein
VGHGVRKVVLSLLVDKLTTSTDGLWEEDSRGLRTLRTTESVISPSGTGNPMAFRASKAFQVRSYAAGLSVLLLFCHAKLPPPITPIMLAIALLPFSSRTAVTTPSFLKMLFEQPSDQRFIRTFEESSPLAPMSASLCSLIHAANIPVSLIYIQTNFTTELAPGPSTDSNRATRCRHSPVASAQSRLVSFWSQRCCERRRT